MERVNLLVSDIDNTLLGDDGALDEFSAWYDLARADFRLAYSSGRFFEPVLASIENSRLPMPDAIVCGVGTEIRFPPSGCRLENWPADAENWDAQAVRAVLVAHKELEPQPDHLQSELKVSFFGYELEESFLIHLQRQYSDLGHKVDIVYSSDRDLDILPSSANKGTAAARLADYWQIDPQRVIVAGDSGNDRAMFEQGFRGIVVGNAKPELRALTGPNIYHATGHFAAGVLEGLNYWLASANK